MNAIISTVNLTSSVGSIVAVLVSKTVIAAVEGRNFSFQVLLCNYDSQEHQEMKKKDE